MLQDFERGQQTEIDFINGYVAQLGAELGVPVVLNTVATQPSGFKCGKATAIRSTG